MAEPARRTVVIRGQVVDRYSPRRSMVEPDQGERRRYADPGTVHSLHRSPDHHGEVARLPLTGQRPDIPVNGQRPDILTGQRPDIYAARRSASAARRRRPYDPPRARPDRIALWAVLLGVVLLLAAATSSHAAVLAHLVAR